MWNIIKGYGSSLIIIFFVFQPNYGIVVWKFHGDLSSEIVRGEADGGCSL